MIVGSLGECLETCGDGRNYGMEMCDDGNTLSGDGCSSSCLVENDYQCSGGYPYKQDTCSYIETEIVEVKSNKHNDLIVKFSRPISAKDGTLSQRDFVLTYRNQHGIWQYISYKPLLYNMPSRYLYLKTEIVEDIKGGVFMDNFVKVSYKNSGMIQDYNGKALKKDTYGNVWINPYEKFQSHDKADVEAYT